jgi:hypothetical protein
MLFVSKHPAILNYIRKNEQTPFKQRVNGRPPRCIYEYLNESYCVENYTSGLDHRDLWQGKTQDGDEEEGV